MRQNNENFEIYDHSNKISTKDFEDIFYLIKKENTYTILSKLSKETIGDYLNIVVNSKKLLLISCKINNKIIGYALFAQNPEYLISEFKKIKFRILIDLIKNLRFVSILNIIISILGIDLIFLKKNDINLIRKNLNLNLLAINSKYQSKGIGAKFFKRSLKYIFNQHFKFNLLSCEAPNLRAMKFYLDKINFKFVGKKLRLFRYFYVLFKDYDTTLDLS